MLRRNSPAISGERLTRHPFQAAPVSDLRRRRLAGGNQLDAAGHWTPGRVCGRDHALHALAALFAGFGWRVHKSNRCTKRARNAKRCSPRQQSPRTRFAQNALRALRRCASREKFPTRELLTPSFDRMTEPLLEYEEAPWIEAARRKTARATPGDPS